MILNTCIQGDCRDAIRSLIDDGVKVQCIVTSPPYWGLRDYGMPDQIGQEKTFSEYLENLKEVFGLCKDLLSDYGTLWLNMGDSYAGSRKGRNADSRAGDTVFDPFLGSGTVAQVAQRLGRNWLGVELNPDYIELQNKRTCQMGMRLV